EGPEDIDCPERQGRVLRQLRARLAARIRHAGPEMGGGGDGHLPEDEPDHRRLRRRAKRVCRGTGAGISLDDAGYLQPVGAKPDPDQSWRDPAYTDEGAERKPRPGQLYTGRSGLPQRGAAPILLARRSEER